MRPIDGDALKIMLDTFATIVGFSGVYDRGQVMECIDAAPTVATDTNVLGKWISVKDRLPEEQGVYLVAFKPPLPKVTIAWWATREYGWYDLEYNFHTDSVSHWMPMPKLPKEVNENEAD